MRKDAATPTAFEREWVYFLWTLFASAMVLLGFMKMVE